MIRLPPMRFVPLRRFPGAGQPLVPGKPTPGFGASSAFHTLSRLCSARRLPALFHADPARGVLPFRVDFHLQSRASLSGALALLRFACLPDHPLQLPSARHTWNKCR